MILRASISCEYILISLYRVISNPCTDRICLRRAALRVLSSSQSTTTLLSTKSRRSVTSIAQSPINRSCLQRSTPLAFQRRWASEEATTQSEPEADGATEASQGNNSIAASADTGSSHGISAAEQQEPTGSSSSTVEDASKKASQTTSSAARTVSQTASSAAGQVGQATRSARDSVVGAARDVGAAAGLGSGNPRNEIGSAAGEPSKTVYVGNLFFDVRGEDLKKEFERAGPVANTKVIMDQRGLSKG